MVRSVHDQYMLTKHRDIVHVCWGTRDEAFSSSSLWTCFSRSFFVVIIFVYRLSAVAKIMHQYFEVYYDLSQHVGYKIYSGRNGHLSRFEYTRPSRNIMCSISAWMQCIISSHLSVSLTTTFETASMQFSFRAGYTTVSKLVINMRECMGIR